MRKTIISLLLILAVCSSVPAGDLEPSEPPGPTMKTLDQLPPVWSRVLPSNDGPDVCHSSRFLCVMNGDYGVLDQETGLVWQKRPFTDPMTWYDAILHCYGLEGGGRHGWRLPGQAELASLVDYSLNSPALPPGHPFEEIQLGKFWSANTYQQHNDTMELAWLVDIEFGGAGWRFNKTDSHYVWCVRGGSGIDMRSSRL